MTVWRSISSEKQIVRSLHIEDGILSYFRKNGAVTRIEIDDLKNAELLVINENLYWYLLDRSGAFALIPEQIPEIGILRRYLSSWRGFNYDGLLRFNPELDERIQLWPLQADHRNRPKSVIGI